MGNPIFENLLPVPKNSGFKMDDCFIWCGSAVRGEDGRYHIFASRWRKELGFGAQWLFNCEIVRAASEKPEGPYIFEEIVFKRRERNYFDALNQHNPSIKFWNGTYYLFYSGTTYGGPIPGPGDDISPERAVEVWNNKRIGLATSNSVYGPWKRPEIPLLEPRKPGNWDCTITTNPTAVIQEDGTTYLVYKSREYACSTLQLGVARASRPEEPYMRIQDDPIFKFKNPDFHVEDPFIWYSDGKFHGLFKDDFKNNCGGITGEWGAGVYATSEDCINWSIYPQPKAYSRTVRWDDQTTTIQCNLERPNLLFHDGKPTHLFLATGVGCGPFNLTDSWNMVIPLKA